MPLWANFLLKIWHSSKYRNARTRSLRIKSSSTLHFVCFESRILRTSKIQKILYFMATKVSHAPSLHLFYLEVKEFCLIDTCLTPHQRLERIHPAALPVNQRVLLVRHLLGTALHTVSISSMQDGSYSF